MNRFRRSGEWSVVLFVAALLAFNPPILSIFSVPQLLFGIPLLYFYIFVAWAVVIVLLALNVSGLTEPDDEAPLRISGPLPEALSGANDDGTNDGGEDQVPDIGDGRGGEAH